MYYMYKGIIKTMNLKKSTMFLRLWIFLWYVNLVINQISDTIDQSPWTTCNTSTPILGNYICNWSRLKQLNLLSSISCFRKYQFDSDSLSCLQSLYNMNIDHPYISSTCISHYYHQVLEKDKIVNFCWIPSNIGIFGSDIKQKWLQNPHSGSK